MHDHRQQTSRITTTTTTTMRVSCLQYSSTYSLPLQFSFTDGLGRQRWTCRLFFFAASNVPKIRWMVALNLWKQPGQVRTTRVRPTASRLDSASLTGPATNGLVIERTRVYVAKKCSNGTMPTKRLAGCPVQAGRWPNGTHTRTRTPTLHSAN